MARDLTVAMEDRPGALAELGEAVGRAGINLGGGCGVVTADGGVIHLLVDGSEDDARAALDAAGIEVTGARDVVVVDVRDQPGTLGSYARKLGDVGVNIDLFYVATGTRLVFGVDDLEAAQQALT